MKHNPEFVNSNDFNEFIDRGKKCQVCGVSVKGLLHYCARCHRSKLSNNVTGSLESENRDQDFLEALGG